MHEQLSTETRGLKYDLSVPLLPYFIYKCGKGSGETVWMRTLVWTLVARQCDKYKNVMCRSNNIISFSIMLILQVKSC